jgi:hypothetical protein
MSVVLFLFSTNVFSKNYSITKVNKSYDKSVACSSALINAKAMAIEEFGVRISSSFNSSKNVSNGDVSSSQKQNIIQESENHVSVISYSESVKKNGDYYFCEVNAVISVGEPKRVLTVKPEEVKNNNKKYVRSCSVVTGIHVSNSKGKPIFINFGRSYPNQIFSAVIWGSNRNKFSYDLNKKLLNRQVCIKGEVSIYKGKPSFNLKDETQIEL